MSETSIYFDAFLIILLLLKYVLLIMLLQLSQFFSSLYFPLPCMPHPPEFHPLSSCPWVVHISSLASLLLILFLISPYFMPTNYAS